MSLLLKKLLGMLNNIGAVNPSNALTLVEISNRIKMDMKELGQKLEELVKAGYVGKVRDLEEDKYYLTPTGILVALSAYS
ncbi:MAG: hypothetical protein J7L11_02210 [Thermoprotei archaeon]|nr:hypothetical protein [Thermoprotei archaeon]